MKINLKSLGLALLVSLNTLYCSTQKELKNQTQYKEKLEQMVDIANEEFKKAPYVLPLSTEEIENNVGRRFYQTNIVGLAKKVDSIEINREIKGGGPYYIYNIVVEGLNRGKKEYEVRIYNKPLIYTGGGYPAFSRTADSVEYILSLLIKNKKLQTKLISHRARFFDSEDGIYRWPDQIEEKHINKRNYIGSFAVRKYTKKVKLNDEQDKNLKQLYRDILKETKPYLVKQHNLNWKSTKSDKNNKNNNPTEFLYNPNGNWDADIEKSKEITITKDTIKTIFILQNDSIINIEKDSTKDIEKKTYFKRE